MPTAAAETLRATAVNEHILDARLFTRDGTLLATYVRPGCSPSARPAGRDATRPGVEPVAVFEGRPPARRPADLARTTRSSAASRWSPTPTEVWTRLARFAAIVAGTLFGAFWIALGLSRTTARLIFEPDRAAHRGDASRARRRPLRRPRRRRATTTKSAS